MNKNKFKCKMFLPPLHPQNSYYWWGDDSFNFHPHPISPPRKKHYYRSSLTALSVVCVIETHYFDVQKIKCSKYIFKNSLLDFNTLHPISNPKTLQVNNHCAKERREQKNKAGIQDNSNSLPKCNLHFQSLGTRFYLGRRAGSPSSWGQQTCRYMKYSM